MLPVVPAVSVEETGGTESAPFKFKVPVPGVCDMLMTFESATELVNEIPPLAFKVPDEILIVAVRELSVEAPVNKIGPVTVADPASILQALATLATVD